MEGERSHHYTNPAPPNKGTQTEQDFVGLVESEKEQEAMAAKVFCLDEENEGSDSEADDSGWEDDDEDTGDYFYD